MKRLFFFVLILVFLCGCTQNTPSETIPTITIQEVSQFSAPYFDPQLIIETMSVEELVGQLFLARCPSNENAIDDIKNYHLGGYVLFGRDFEDKTAYTISATIQSYQDAATIPLLIAADEEGGTVCRVSNQPLLRSQRFPSPRNLYANGGMELLSTTEEEKCQLLSSLGINVNMAPVCDITTDSNAFMYSRSLGLAPQETGTCITQIVNIMNQYQVGSVLKHFPGYGNNTDTHIGIAIDNRTLEELSQVDLIPFNYGIEAGCGGIMISHTVINSLDSDLPASLSPTVIRYLREDMAFNGVIMTDDLVMGAITDRYGAGESAVMAVQAGNDLLCSSEYVQQYNAVLDAVNSGRIAKEDIEKSVSRVLLWKYTLGLLTENA